MPALQAGLRIPEDIAVTGYDNRYAGICYPKLTTVAQPFSKMGAESVRMLFRLMTGKRDGRHSIYLPHNIILRGFTEDGPEYRHICCVYIINEILLQFNLCKEKTHVISGVGFLLYSGNSVNTAIPS